MYQQVMWKLIVLCCLTLEVPLTSHAVSYTFTPIKFPDTSYTRAFGINNNGDIVGVYNDATGKTHGFLFSGGSFTTIDFPGAFSISSFDINNNGDIIGSLSGACASGNQCGYLLSGGSFSEIAFPGAVVTIAHGINDAGDIVGVYYEPTGKTHGFLFSGGSFTTIDFPGDHSYNEASGINNAGDIVGIYSDPGNPHHYLLSDGSFSTVDFPGFQNILGPLGINNAGDIVGSFFVGGGIRSYLLSGGSFSEIAFPGAPITHAHGINDNGWIVGRISDLADQNIRGFLAIPVSVPVIVEIDIKPGGDPNSINCNNDNGVITVALLTTDDFDAATVDHTTVTFEGASETHVDRQSGEPRRHEEDVDGDGDIDLVFHFRLGETELDCGSTEGTLTGETFDGQSVEGTDSVNMIGS